MTPHTPHDARFQFAVVMVRDQDRSLRFYVDELGFRLLHDGSDLHARFLNPSLVKHFANRNQIVIFAAGHITAKMFSSRKFTYTLRATGSYCGL